MNNSPWHSQSQDNLLKSLNTDKFKGLTNEDVQKRLEKFGLNTITLKKGKSALVRFLLQIHQPLIYVLLLSATIALFLGEYIDAAVIYGVVLVNALMGFFQEDKALKDLEKLTRAIDIKAHVIRDADTVEISSTGVVPGDIVLLRSGEKVPADIRLIQVTDLKIDESALTGESVPSQKNANILAEKTLLADRQNMAYSSTLVTFGTAKGVVVETGNHTEIGKISKMISDADDLKTPLTGIKNYAELLGQDNVSGQDKQVYLENLQHYIDRLNNLIEDLFEVSKVNSGNIELNPVELNVVALIQQAQAETEDLLKQKNLTVILDAPENGIVQALDGDKTYRIFENLFTNIAKYTLPGTRVYVSATAQPEYTEIVFKNISEAQMNFTPEEIVERFVRGDKSRHESGSGIGLAIVKSFTEVQNGTFSIEIDGDLFKAVVRFKVN